MRSWSQSRRERDEEGPLAGKGGSGFSVKWVDAKHQAADDWTKGLFTEQKRDETEGSELAGGKREGRGGIDKVSVGVAGNVSHGGERSL